ncbi:hypothetical protein LCGC14_1016960 [marine sediment metagenome]|uniref:Uncharacterized protein n=1 Tax=marine sediment metagenome TaxID=412755 RepID=A0A0F9MYJ0_9ZZZZ
MTPAQNRALRSVLINHLRHLDRFIMYLETAPGVRLKNTIFEGIRLETSYQRATLRAAIQQLEDQHDRPNDKATPKGHGLSIPEPARSRPNRTQ